jgi:hypothetical protein
VPVTRSAVGERRVVVVVVVVVDAAAAAAAAVADFAETGAEKKMLGGPVGAVESGGRSWSVCAVAADADADADADVEPGLGEDSS